MSFQIPSLDWPRRIAALSGTEDLLKQNPIGDGVPEEERIPVLLVSNFTISNISLDSVGTGTSLIKGKFANSFQFHTVKGATGGRIVVNLTSDTIEIDADAATIANSISLSDLGDVIDSPTNGEFLQYNGSTWITSPLVSEFYITDGSNTETIDGSNQTITFQSTSNFQFSVSPTNIVQGTWTANLNDLSDVGLPSNPNQVFIWNGSSYEWEDFNIVASGGVTEAANVGSLGYGVFSSKIGTTLRFRNISANSSKIDVTLTGNDIKIDANPSDIANEINLVDLLDVDGSPSDGDTIVYNSGLNQWVMLPSDASTLSVAVEDQSFDSNNFTSVTALRIYGSNGISTNFTSATDLEIDWSANLEGLGNVTISSPASGQTLIFNQGTSQWENDNIQFTVLGNSGSQNIKNKETFRMLGVGGINIQVASPKTALVTLNASITDLNDVNSPSNANQLLLWNGTNYVWVNQSTVGGGESNTGQNIGTEGYGTYFSKSGTTLNFRNIAANSDKISVTLDGNNNIKIDAVPLEIGNEIRLQDLLDVTNLPGAGGYLKYTGTEWTTEIASLNFNFEIQGDIGINNQIEDGDLYIIAGDEQFIATYNFASGGTKKTEIRLDIDATAEAIFIEDLGNVFGNPNVNDTLSFNGTHFVFAPLPTTTFSNSWLLDGNNEVSEYAFGTLNNFDIPIKVNNVVVGKIKTDGKFGWGTQTPTSTIEVNGSLGLGNVVHITSNYNVTDDDYMIIANASGGTIIVTIPDAVNLYRREYVIKKIDSTSNEIIISSSSLIDASNNYNIDTQWVAIKIKSDDNQWFVY